MPTDTERRVLATFDAFLEYVRGGSAPRSLSASPFPDESTDPSLSAERLDLPPPRQGTGASRARRGDFDDDESTVVGNIPAPKAPGAHANAGEGGRTQSRRPEPEQSIIVDDQALEPEHPSGNDVGSRGENFVREMATLIKYGHGAQVPPEIARFVRSNSEDLDALFRVAEFEYAKVDAEQGLERLFQAASRALDAGDLQLARRVLERAGKVAPNDLRVLALNDRVRGR